MKDVKQILITGKNSYIGESLEKWLKKSDGKYNIDTVDMRDDLWRKVNFSNYDTVFHVAGIAHIKETKENRDLYYKVNRDLAYETAKKVKNDGAKQFIFLSSMSVYGIDSGKITISTPPMPKSAYGKSKLEAENLIRELESENFKVSILRPPMVYGKGAKGNYQLLSKFAKSSPIFPEYQNKRSMIYIDNLSSYIEKLIATNESGTYFPQNKNFVSTSSMVKEIALYTNKNIKFVKLFNPIIRLLLFITIIKKVFGNLYYEIDEDKISTVDFVMSIHMSEEYRAEI